MERLGDFGFEHDDNLLLSDHDQFYWDDATRNIPDHGRQDWNWIISETPLSTID